MGSVLGITGKINRCEGLVWGTGHRISSTRLHRFVCYACFFGSNVEALPAYSVHVGDRLADPGLHCLPTNRQLQPAQCSTVSRKFRRAGSGITFAITECEETSLRSIGGFSSTFVDRIVMQRVFKARYPQNGILPFPDAHLWSGAQS